MAQQISSCEPSQLDSRRWAVSYWAWRQIFSLLHDFYARKQLLLSARFSRRNSVRLSHGWISQKRCKLGSPNLYQRLPGGL